MSSVSGIVARNVIIEFNPAYARYENLQSQKYHNRELNLHLQLISNEFHLLLMARHLNIYT